jgi:riboflavin synthase
LTINRCEKRFFEVNIIPLTGRETTIIKKKLGDLVNIETDLIGKYVEKFLLLNKSAQQENAVSSIDLDMLIEHGFGE